MASLADFPLIPFDVSRRPKRSPHDQKSARRHYKTSSFLFSAFVRHPRSFSRWLSIVLYRINILSVTCSDVRSAVLWMRALGGATFMERVASRSKVLKKMVEYRHVKALTHPSYPQPN